MPAPTECAKPLLAALRGRTLPRPPLWLMRQAGRYLPEYRAVRAQARGFLDLCYNPSLAAEVTLQPVRRFALDAAIIFSDILVVPHALGCDVRFQKGEGPRLEALEDGVGVARLRVDEVTTRLAPVYETLARVRSDLAEDVALLGFAGAPWTLATYMLEGGPSVGFVAAKRWAYTREDDFAALMGVLEEATARHLAAQVEAGADAVQIFDSWAGVLTDPAFERWCVGPTARVVAAFKARHRRTPVIGFPRGASTEQCHLYAERTGIDALSLHTTLPLAAAAEMQRRRAVQGNLDPALLVIGGAALDGEVRRILAALAAGPFVFNLGHGVLPETPPDNVARLVDVVRAWGAEA